MKSPGARFASRRVFALCLLPFAFYLSGCRQDMQDQPRYEVYEPSKSFSDGLSSRPYVEGTVARGYRDVNTAFYTGKNAAGGAGASAQSGGTTAGGAGLTPQSSVTASTQNAQGSNASAGTQTGGDVNVRGNVSGNVPGAGQTGTPGGVNEFPFVVTKADLDRGQERFNIYCAMCHGQTGYGDGMIVRRGFRRPPSLHDERLRGETLGHFFDVITNGWGAMPDYSQEIPPRDRWAIIAYIRALQLSQNTVASEVPENLRNQRKPGPGTPTTDGDHQGTGGERTP
ncbi:MAG TPA: cytochrome c [Pyrinomonadaceae bacterium]|nr:cytochrome c [Pyrinomonadaceae bacterium]